jgi:hypothetical protein
MQLSMRWLTEILDTSLDICGCVGFEVLTSVGVNSSVFSDITICSSLKVNRRFGRRFRLLFRVEEQAKQETSVK